MSCKHTNTQGHVWRETEASYGKRKKEKKRVGGDEGVDYFIIRGVRWEKSERTGVGVWIMDE